MTPEEIQGVVARRVRQALTRHLADPPTPLELEEARAVVDKAVRRLLPEGRLPADVKVTGWHDLDEETQAHIKAVRAILLQDGVYGTAVRESVEELVGVLHTWLTRKRWTCPQDRLEELEREFTIRTEDGGEYVDWSLLRDRLASGEEPTAYLKYHDPGPPEGIWWAEVDYHPIAPVDFVSIVVTL